MGGAICSKRSHCQRVCHNSPRYGLLRPVIMDNGQFSSTMSYQAANPTNPIPVATYHVSVPVYLINRTTTNSATEKKEIRSPRKTNL
ncbi:hypothetical protein CEXT_376891 [Caerostris extrusa]|uniref:Uncharacterized protein n=1 Tax=Caerostris extrusa TaxID=172846 RepID=A0AAV4WQB8_CAEEX|nr:hypothetical protein CEXT_376891 [Caerostris extrusa]